MSITYCNIMVIIVSWAAFFAVPSLKAQEADGSSPSSVYRDAFEIDFTMESSQNNQGFRSLDEDTLDLSPEARLLDSLTLIFNEEDVKSRPRPLRRSETAKKIFSAKTLVGR